MALRSVSELSIAQFNKAQVSASFTPALGKVELSQSYYTSRIPFQSPFRTTVSIRVTNIAYFK